MKKLLFTYLSLFLAVGLMAQCDDLFFSEYVEGSNNNRALEIYNPTNEAVNLSDYSVIRFRNGATNISASNGGPIVLPNRMLQPFDVYVVALDRRDPNGTGFDVPVWNGFNVFETGIDSLSGEVIINGCTGEPRQFVQYVDGNNQNAFEYESTYKAQYDLEGKADTFASPVYAVNNHMSFNGDDAMLLVKGTTIANDGSNVLDVIGVIGEDPGDTWIDHTGRWITRNNTIVRRAWVNGGTGPVVLALGDTLASVEWDYNCSDDFSFLGSHQCDCDPTFVDIVEPTNDIPVNIFPNPTNNLLNINAATQIQYIELYDLTGKRITQQNNADSTNDIQLNVSNLPSGIYLVNIIFNTNQSTVKKFVVK